jgi:hypothetical protein
MPQPRHKYDHAIRVAIANAPPGATAKQVHDDLSREMLALGIPEADVPSAATIQRRRNEVPDEELVEWREVRWPDSFGPGGLPYDAEAAVIELLAYGLHRQRRRPLLKAAAWFWRISRIRDAPIEDRLCAAWCMTAIDAGGLDAARRQEIERWLMLGGPREHYAFFGFGDVADVAGGGAEAIARYFMDRHAGRDRKGQEENNGK